MKLKHYELIENLDPHMAQFTHIAGNLYRESLYELDVVYFGFIRFNLKLQERKRDLINILYGQMTLPTKLRDTLPNLVTSIISWDICLDFHGFQSMYQRRTYLKFDKLQDLPHIYPEYFI